MVLPVAGAGFDFASVPVCTFVLVLEARKRRTPAGFVIALGLFRPQLVAPFVLMMLLAGKWKFIRGFVTGAIIVVSLSAWVVGLKGLADYFHILFSQGTQQSG